MSRPSISIPTPEQLKELWEDRAGRLLRRVGLGSVRTTILTLAVMATLIPAVATSWISYRQNSRAIEARLQEELAGASTQGAREVQLWLRQKQYDLKVFAASYEVTEYLERGGSSRRLPEYLRSINTRFRDVDELMVIAPDERIVAASGSQGAQLRFTGNWIRRARDGEAVLGDPQRADTANIATMDLAVPIVSATGRFLGVFGARLNLRGIGYPLNSLVSKPERRLLVLRGDGESIVALGAAPGAVSTAVLRELEEAAGRSVAYTSTGGEAVVGVLTSIQATDWKVVAEVPATTAYADIRRMRSGSVLFVLILLGIVGSLAYGLGLLIVLPLERLSKAARLVASGNLDVDVPASGGGEVSELAGVFNDMVRRLREGREELERLSVTDDLTGLANRRLLTSELARELLRSSRHTRTFAVLMLDVDRFKIFNDTHGHPAGDAVLKQLAEILRENTREVDTVARYGGEEFLLILPETTAVAAKQFAERVRAVTEAHKFLIDDGATSAKVTVSIGVAVYPKNAETADALVEAADDALYRSKQGGRNRVTLAG